MRTKTLLLAAVLSAAGAATSSAQVYSVNMVGYINKVMPPGFSMIANQLNATPDNKVTTLFAALPNNSAVYKFTGTGYQVNSFIDGAWEGDDLNMTLAPGEGVFIFIPGTASVTNTFVGEVRIGTGLPNPIPAGFSVRSSVIPQSLPLSGAPPAGLNYPIANNDAVYQFTGTGYKVNTFVDGAWEGDGGGQPPVPAIGESFFVFNAGAAKTWLRDFSVN